MSLRRVRWENEAGFTLIELLITIAIVIIAVTIASSDWFGAVESRKVDSATNEMASELRRAQTNATNRLAPWRVVLQLNTRKYQIGPTGGALTSEILLDDKAPAESDPNPPVKLTGAVTVVEFRADGGATITGSGNILVASGDGCPRNQIEINTVTSRIKVSPIAC